MATTNVGRFLQGRYRAAISKYGRGKDTHAEALEELSDLLMDDHLSSVHRLKANAALADGVLDWFLAESYRSAAELIFTNIRDSIPIIPGAPIEGEIAFLRDLLDSLAAEQQRDDPRQPHDMASTPRGPEMTVERTDQSIATPQAFQPMELPIMGPPSRTPPHPGVDNDQASSKPLRPSQQNTPKTTGSIPGHFSASKPRASPRRREPDERDFTGSPSKRRRD